MKYVPVIVVGVVLLMLVAERAFPLSLRLVAAPRRQRWARLLKNLAIAGINFAGAPVVAMWITAYAIQSSFIWRPIWLSGWFALAADLLLLDLWIYGWHRAVHAWSFTWRLHQVHHMDEEVDVTTALRFHAGDVMLSSISRGVVIAVLAIPMRHVFLFEVATILFSTFHHANLRLPRPVAHALGWVIVTPAMHRLHHHPSRSIHDTNFGTILSGWDRLFGSMCNQERTNETEVGLEGRPDEGLLALLARPFRRGDRLKPRVNAAAE